MHLMPDANAIAKVAESIGAHIGQEEAAQYRPYLLDLLRLVDQFMQERTVTSPPPMLFPDRGPGYRPGLAEDPYRAWLWKCDVGGTDAGLLAGKRVSFKDHISVARIPQVFTTQAMEGFNSRGRRHGRDARARRGWQRRWQARHERVRWGLRIAGESPQPGSRDRWILVRIRRGARGG